MEQLTNGVDVLVVGKLDRLSRSRLDFARLVQQSQSEGWAIVVLDIGIDPTTSPRVGHGDVEADQAVDGLAGRHRVERVGAVRTRGASGTGCAGSS